jgi:UDP-N-acetylmuramate--alanine ligase
LVTNINGDHFDVFRDMTDYENAFKEFFAKLTKNGSLITHNDITLYSNNSKFNIIDTDKFDSPELQVPGKHMQENAKLVMALADHLGIKDIEKSLSEYSGCWRRSEIKGEFSDALLIDDYAHHPREIKTTLEGIKKSYPDRRLVCVFQPHTHDRTIKLYDEFLVSFESADVVIIPNIYDARGECDSGKVDIEKFIADIQEGSNAQVIHGKSLEETALVLKDEIIKPGDVVITMGAGDVWKICDMLNP